MSSDNQTVFEVIRDVGTLIQRISAGETLWLNVRRDSDMFFTARSSNGMPCGKSETSNAIKQAFQVTRGMPDPRDVRIAELEQALKRVRNNTPCGWEAKALIDPVLG